MDVKYLVPILLVFLLVGVLSLFKRAKETEDADYDSRKFLLTKGELAFYKILNSSKPENHILVSKVRISDLLAVRKGLDRSRRQSALNKINAKHVDFVLCNATDMSIVAAIELDDASHNRADRVNRDKFVDSAFNSAKIPLIRFKAKSQYNSNEVIQILQERLPRDGSIVFPNDILGSDLKNTVEPISEGIEDLNCDNEVAEFQIPDCPKCNEPMRLRSGKRGELKGKQFWGCSNYPKCKAVVTIS